MVTRRLVSVNASLSSFKGLPGVISLSHVNKNDGGGPLNGLSTSFGYHVLFVIRAGSRSPFCKFLSKSSSLNSLTLFDFHLITCSEEQMFLSWNTGDVEDSHLLLQAGTWTGTL